MPSGPAIENPEIKPYLEQYAGQPLTSIPVGVLALASRIASRGNFENTLTNFARLGYAPIPVDMAAQLAHTLFHLLAEGGVVSREVTCITSICGRPRLASGRQYRPIACLSQKACSSAI